MVEAVEAFGLETGVGIVVETLEALVVEMANVFKVSVSTIY